MAGWQSAFVVRKRAEKENDYPLSIESEDGFNA